MGKHKKNGHTDTFAVVGLGNFGSTVANELIRFGNYVIGMDIDERSVNAQAETLNQALIVDARDEGALEEAGVADCRVALIAIGDDLESSVLAAINVKTLGVPVVWAKATTKTHHRILSKLKVDRIIHPEVEVGHHIAQVLHNPLVRDYISLGNGFNVVNFRIPESLEGKTLSEIPYDEAHDLRCVGAMRGTEWLGRDGDDVTLQKDDLLLLLGQRPNLRKFAATL